MFDKRIKLFDYQEEIAHDTKKKMLLMDAGTGKTFTALRRAQLTWCPKLLVICLAPKVKEWQEDIMTFAYSYDWDMTRDTSETLRGKRGNDKLVAKGDTIKSAVVSYESVARIPQLLKWVDEDTFVIIDESHKVKNSTSKMSRGVYKLTKQARDQVLLTATPQSKGYIDYFAQLRIAGYLPWQRVSKKHWLNRYAKVVMMEMGGFKVPQIVGYRFTDELDSIINNISAYHTNAYDSYHPITRKVDTGDNALGRKYQKLVKNRVYTDKTGETHIYDQSGKLYLAERKAATGMFADDLLYKGRLEYVKMLIEEEIGNDRVIIFYNYNSELKVLKDMLQEIKRPMSEYNGHTKDIDNFETKDNAVILVNYASGSTGLNIFTKAHHTIFYSLPNSHITYYQAKKRTDRIGQKYAPNYYVMITRETVEEAVFQTLVDGKDFDEKLYLKYQEKKAPQMQKPFVPEVADEEVKNTNKYAYTNTDRSKSYPKKEL